MQIAKQLEQEKVLIPSAYYASLGRKTRKQYTHPYAWDQKTVAGILANQQYTGCTVNFMTTTVSYKVHKTVYNPKDEWQIIPNTQPAIIDEDTWKRVQELRENRIRPTATGRTSLFPAKCSVRTAVQSSISVPPRALTPIRSITAAPTTKAAEETVRYTISAM